MAHKCVRVEKALDYKLFAQFRKCEESYKSAFRRSYRWVIQSKHTTSIFNLIRIYSWKYITCVKCVPIWWQHDSVQVGYL